MPIKPTKEDVADALNRTVPDIIAPNLRVLFCGINPGIYSGATRLHFARPGNRFWKALHLSGFTKRQLDPSEGRELLDVGCGITCIVERTTARADELTREDYIEGGRVLEAKVAEFRPKVIAFVAMTAYRIAFDRPKAKVGKQAETFGDTGIWLLPNPSGLNANYQLPDFVRLFQELREEISD